MTGADKHSSFFVTVVNCFIAPTHGKRVFITEMQNNMSFQQMHKNHWDNDKPSLGIACTKQFVVGLELRRVIYVDPRRSQFTRGNMHHTSLFYMGLTSAEDQWPVL